MKFKLLKSQSQSVPVLRNIGIFGHRKYGYDNLPPPAPLRSGTPEEQRRVELRSPPSYKVRAKAQQPSGEYPSFCNALIESFA